jgi:uncharacterized membrane protein
MLNLMAAAVMFLVIHLVPSSPLRAWAVERIGAPAYMAVFGVVSLSILIWLVTAFGDAPAFSPLYVTGAPLRLLSAAVMLVAFVLLVVGVTSPNPSMPGGEGALERAEPWRGVFSITRHPVMWGIGLWALVHLLNRPDMPGLIFFGALALLSIGGAKIQENRKRAELGQAWSAFAARTSFVPFVALARGQAQFVLSDFSLWRVIGGVVVWAIVLSQHALLFGVSPLPV